MTKQDAEKPESSGKPDHDNAPGRPETYKIIVDRKPHDWPRPKITGNEIKRLAGVDLTKFDAWQDVPGPDDKLIGDDTPVDLTARGTERFFTIKRTTTEG